MLSFRHPGEAVRDLLDGEKIDVSDFSKRSMIGEETARDLVSCKVQINTEIASKLEQFFGLSSEYWLNYQRGFDRFNEVNNSIASLSAENIVGTCRAMDFIFALEDDELNLVAKEAAAVLIDTLSWMPINYLSKSEAIIESASMALSAETCIELSRKLDSFIKDTEVSSAGAESERRAIAIRLSKVLNTVEEE